MVCYLCKIDKELYLFTPSRQNAKAPSMRVCSKCVSERAGKQFGAQNTAAERRGFQKLQASYRYQDNAYSAKARIRAAEVAELLESRKRRLAEGKSKKE